MRLEDVKPSDEQLRVVLESGFVLREAGRLDDAETVFRGVHQLLPASDVPLVGLSTVILQKGDPNEARTLCEQALNLNPVSLYSRVHRAEALLFDGKRDEAETELRLVIAQDSESPHSRTAQALLDAADIIAQRASASS